MQGVAAKNDPSYALSRARASVTGQTTIAAPTATTSLPNGRIVTRGCPAPTQWRSVKSCPISPSNPSAAVGTPGFWSPSQGVGIARPAGPTDVVYRFPYLPTFRPAISVRIERRDSIRMTVSQTEGWGGATIRKASHGREPFGCHCRPGTHWSWRSRRPTSGRIPYRKDQESSTDRGGFLRASGQTGVF
jgi:hypothetical protein